MGQRQEVSSGVCETTRDVLNINNIGDKAVRLIVTSGVESMEHRGVLEGSKAVLLSLHHVNQHGQIKAALIQLRLGLLTKQRLKLQANEI